jgi:phospholipase D1/2
VRDQLISAHLGVSVGEFERAMLQCRSFVKAIDSLLGWGKTLRQVTEQTVSGEASPLAESDLTDPDHVPRSLARSVQRFIAGFRG